MPGVADTVVAVDIGGTKLAAGLVGGSARIPARAVAPTPRDADTETVFRTLVGLVDELGPGRGDATVCGIGTGGPMTAGGETLSPVHAAPGSDPRRWAVTPRS